MKIKQNMMIKELKQILKKNNVELKEFAEVIGLTYGSLRVMLSGKVMPKWVKAFMFAYNLKK